MTATNDTGITPIQDQVLVRRDQADKKMAGGLLWRPDAAWDWPTRGTVLAVGPSVKDPGLVPGARVFFRPRPGSALVPDNREPGEKDKRAWERVIVLRSGDLPRPRPAGPSAAAVHDGMGDILGIIEEE